MSKLENTGKWLEITNLLPNPHNFEALTQFLLIQEGWGEDASLHNCTEHHYDKPENLEQ